MNCNGQTFLLPTREEYGKLFDFVNAKKLNIKNRGFKEVTADPLRCSDCSFIPMPQCVSSLTCVLCLCVCPRTPGRRRLVWSGPPTPLVWRDYLLAWCICSVWCVCLNVRRVGSVCVCVCVCVEWGVCLLCGHLGCLCGVDWPDDKLLGLFSY